MECLGFLGHDDLGSNNPPPTMKLPACLRVSNDLTEPNLLHRVAVRIKGEEPCASKLYGGKVVYKF